MSLVQRCNNRTAKCSQELRTDRRIIPILRRSIVALEVELGIHRGDILQMLMHGIDHDRSQVDHILPDFLRLVV